MSSKWSLSLETQGPYVHPKPTRVSFPDRERMYPGNGAASERQQKFKLQPVKKATRVLFIAFLNLNINM